MPKVWSGAGEFSIRFRRHYPDFITDSDCARADYLSENALSVVRHQLAKTTADSVHFLARVTRRGDEQHPFADLDLATDQRHEVDAGGFDIGAHCAGRDGLQTKRGGVFGDLLAFNQAHLTSARLALTADPAKVTRLAKNPFLLNNFNGLSGNQGRARFGWVQAQRSDAAWLGEFMSELCAGLEITASGLTDSASALRQQFPSLCILIRFGSSSW